MEAPLEFYLHLNIDTWQERRSQSRNEIVDRLVEEFWRDFSEERKAAYRKLSEDNQTLMERLAQFTLPVENVLRGDLIPFFEIVGSGKVQMGNQNVAKQFRDQDRDYVVEDRYCVNPDCQCNEVYLSFFRVDRTVGEQGRLTEIFLAGLTFKNKLKIMETYDISRTQADRLAAVWGSTGQKDLGIFKWRYDEVKKIGRRILDANPTPKALDFPDTLSEILEPERPGGLSFGQLSAGRPEIPDPSIRKRSPNEPCFCGSGKKNKKCCGRIR